MNPEHVEIVKQGKKTIEQWRQAHPGERLDLSGAYLFEVNLHRANLTGADLHGSSLLWSELSQANLSCANLSGTDLSAVDIFGANLSEANLYRANLFGADLHRASFQQANLVQAELSGANLTLADLSGANLYDAMLFGSRLIHTSLVGAELTGAKLYGTARDHWNIEGVKCRYVFWDEYAKERSPWDRDLEPGEFERLYAQLPTIEYVFENGMTPLDPLVMDRIVQAINEQSPEFELQIDSINARGLQPTIRFTVQHEDQSGAALEAVTLEYEAKLRDLESERNVLYRLISDKLDNPQKVNIINALPGSFVANDGSTINIQEYIGHLEEIEQVVKDASPETLGEAAKREALDTVSGAFKDMAKGKVKEAAEAVVRLGLEAAPHIVNTGAYLFFKNLVG